MEKLCKNINYRCSYYGKKEVEKKSISVFGFDTEAYDTGQCFMYCTSEGDVWNREDFPHSLFSRKYRNANFVCFNLKYDESAILQFLDEDQLRTLWTTDKVQIGDIKIKIIPHKCLTISKKGHSAKFYDMYNFFQGSLNYNAKKYLGKEKLDIETKTFSYDFVKENWDRIAKYCIQDAILVKELAELIISKFENFGVYPKKLYSTAYISYQYFSKNTNYQVVEKFWKEDQKLLDFSLESYNGGKFEVTEKGTGYFYEYDIVSAYPYEIANLLSLEHARVVWDPKYRKWAAYGFIKVRMKISLKTFSSVALKVNNTCIFYSGYVEKVITKTEYEYLIECNADITIIEAVWIHIDKKEYPYKKEIEQLVLQKKKFKQEGKELDLHTVKIFLNSLYGKFVQLIETKTGYQASTCWNPIYASVITANVRVKISRMQMLYPQIIAVHTDSLISTSKLPIETGKELGDFDFECEGNGLILGCGVYQIGNKIRFRGFPIKEDLFELFDQNKNTIEIPHTHVNSWRECAFHGWEHEKINKFEELIKDVACNFDSKRLWLDDYETFDEIFKRNVKSLPLWNIGIDSGRCRRR